MIFYVQVDTASDLSVLAVMLNAREASLGSIHQQLTALSDDVATMYHTCCAVNGVTPTRVTLQHCKQGETIQTFNMERFLWIFDRVAAVRKSQE